MRGHFQNLVWHAASSIRRAIRAEQFNVHKSAGYRGMNIWRLSKRFEQNGIVLGAVYTVRAE